MRVHRLGQRLVRLGDNEPSDMPAESKRLRWIPAFDFVERSVWRRT